MKLGSKNGGNGNGGGAFAFTCTNLEVKGCDSPLLSGLFLPLLLR
uniref:Uncharacterized protein n=1 Tax=Rhizophora mucronata TaxID=61149 RepID=A0A2P2IMD3_RHIMU